LPDKINPQRRLFSEGRSGENCDVVIDRGANAGTYRQVNTFEHWQQQLSEAKKNQKLERLTDLQQQVLDALEDSGAMDDAPAGLRCHRRGLGQLRALR
jgi:hypothetical protein